MKRTRIVLLALLFAVIGGSSGITQDQNVLPPQLKDVGIDQRLDQPLPWTSRFGMRTETK